MLYSWRRKEAFAPTHHCFCLWDEMSFSCCFKNQNQALEKQLLDKKIPAKSSKMLPDVLKLFTEFIYYPSTPSNMSFPSNMTFSSTYITIVVRPTSQDTFNSWKHPLILTFMLFFLTNIWQKFLHETHALSSLIFDLLDIPLSSRRENAKKGLHSSLQHQKEEISVPLRA